ncbi:MAG: FAD-binding protein, partial [Treponema sp.]|nr:FAD-binding protein [Treponema sp.]
MTVTSTFANNTLIDINIGPHEEAGHILDSVKALLIPRVIGAQSIGVDVVAGATFSSLGVLEAVGIAIEEAGGNADEWRLPLPVNNSTVKLFNYDVIVVGLGGSGTAAYLKASEPVTKNGHPYYPAVYGVEVAGKIGGNSATVGGPMATNSEFIKGFYGIGGYVDEDALKQQWFADMKADVPDDVISARGWNKQNFVAPYGEDSFFGPGAKGQTFALPQITTKIPEYAGGPKWQIVDRFIDESGETVDWLANVYNFHFNLPSGLSFPQYQIVINYGSDAYTTPGGYAYDGTPGDFKTVMFTRAIEAAKVRNPKSNYKLELRANELIMSSEGNVVGVKARYRDGTTYEIYGKTVILATGGFIGNPSMSEEVYGTAWKAEAVETQRGDGIKMAKAVGAAEYNIKTPPAVHISNVKNIVRNKFLYDDRNEDARAKSTVTSMLLKGDSMVVGLMDASDTYPTVEDYRGKRFCKEKAAEMFAMTGLDFMSWAVGGYYAAIFSNDELARIKAEGLRDTQDTMFWMVQGGLPDANVPIPDIDAI